MLVTAPPQVGPPPKLTGEARALADGVRFTSGKVAWHALTREPVRLSGKTLQTELEPMGWKLIRVGR